jgi:hypothetical protein
MLDTSGTHSRLFDKLYKLLQNSPAKFDKHPLNLFLELVLQNEPILNNKEAIGKVLRHIWD